MAQSSVFGTPKNQCVFELGGRVVQVHEPQSNALLAQLCDEQPCHEQQGAERPSNEDKAQRATTAELAVQARDNGLHLLWAESNAATKATTKRTPAPLDLHISLNKIVAQRSFPAPKQGAFNQSLGKRSKVIVDATGGWGGDALLMCSQGYQVHVIERNPVMAVLLQDAMQRLAETDWARNNGVAIPTVVVGEASDLIGELQSNVGADCIYLDPMFPEKRKKSAASNKQMALLQHFVGADLDADQLLSSALASGAPRVAVKRPDYAQPLGSKQQKIKPGAQFSSKLVHYDVYFA